ncbi:MAG TPA: helix-turn-helix domain-containing protein [Kineosporiaceae bacterium]|nr:helix-turn-helix domain-containing protein [Kineosporiaceae bacterium]
MSGLSDAMAIPSPSVLAVAMRTPGQVPALTAHARMLYRNLVQAGPLQAGRVAELLAESGRSPLDQLIQLGLVRETPHGLIAIPRAQVIDELLSEQATLLQRALDEVLSRQRRIRTLLEAGSDLDGDAGERIQAVTVPPGADPSLYAVPDRARRELVAIHPGGRFAPEVLEQSLRRAEASLAAGVRLRVVHQSGALAHRDVVAYLQALEELGAWVRVRDNVPFRLLMIDREAAVCTAPNSGGEDTFVLRGQRVIGLLERVFETAWVDSTPLRTMMAERQRALSFGREEQAEPLPYADGGRTAEPVGREGLDDAALAQRYARLTAQQQLILRCLAEGETDRVIARRTGVTPRTVTRRIAEIYQELGVESRFQAGVVAHRLGLV